MGKSKPIELSKARYECFKEERRQFQRREPQRSLKAVEKCKLDQGAIFIADRDQVDKVEKLTRQFCRKYTIKDPWCQTVRFAFTKYNRFTETDRGKLLPLAFKHEKIEVFVVGRFQSLANEIDDVHRYFYSYQDAALVTRKDGKIYSKRGNNYARNRGKAYISSISQLLKLIKKLKADLNTYNKKQEDQKAKISLNPQWEQSILDKVISEAEMFHQDWQEAYPEGYPCGPAPTRKKLEAKIEELKGYRAAN